mgnify:CR=1 FL=1
MLDDIAIRYGSAPALIRAGGSIGFDRLAARAVSLAAGLRAEGVREGDIVLLLEQNGPAWLETFFASTRLGAVVFAVNPGFRVAELADILRRTRARAIVFRRTLRGVDFAAVLSEASAASRWRPPLAIAIDSPARARDILPYESFFRIAGLPKTAPAPEAGAVIFTTSGTTSQPKFVLHSHRSIVRHAADVAAGFGLHAAGTVLLQALPYSGVFGFCQALAAIVAGRPSVLLDTYDPAVAADMIEDFAVTHFNATDEMLAMLAAAAATGDRSLASLRLVGAASFNRGPDALRAIARQSGMPIVGLYGMSETQALFARRALEDPDESRYCAGGRPVSPAASIRVRDGETGKAIGAAGRGGEIEIVGPSLFSGYYGDPSATAAATAPDGAVRTGDFGWLSADGSFTFETRMGDALRLGGYLVNPSEIADFVASLPGIAACQVVGAEVDGRLKAVAFCIPADGGPIDVETVLTACRAKLARFKVPAVVHELSAFPMVHSPNGAKIQRQALRDIAVKLVNALC